MVKKVLNNPISLKQVTFNNVLKLLYNRDLNKCTQLECNNYCNIENKKSNSGNAKTFVISNDSSNQDTNIKDKNASNTEHEKLFCNSNHACQDVNKCKYIPDKENGNSMLVEALMIDTVNTVSEETFLNMEESSLDFVDDTQYEEDDSLDYNCEEFEPNIDNFEEDELLEDNSWASQVKLQELKSCSISSKQNCTAKEKEVTSKDRIAVVEKNSSTITQIKIEPVEITETVDALPIVKSEPLHNLDEMTVIPDPILTKIENADVVESVCEENTQNSSGSYDVNRFEAFVRSNKMMYALNESTENSEVFSQSGLRVRRQYDPDPEEETEETNMSLLIPQMYEPLNVETVKGTLMQSSSDEDENGVTKTSKDKKKLEKRPRGRPKKNDKSQKESIKNKDKLSTISDVAIITRKMRERIRQEEKKIESSDSENDNITLNKRKDKGADTKNAPENKAEEEIQCNNVDSTERISDSKCTDKNVHNVFTGFTAVDQNEMASYQKYIKYVYDQILPKASEDYRQSEQNTSKPNTSEEDNNKPSLNENSSEDHTFDMHPDEPVEMIECEPTMPFLDIVSEKDQNMKSKTAKNIKKQDNLQDINKNIQEKEERTYIDRHGWHCYSVDSNDQKLYQQVKINLQKLPESFVDTYLKYQGIVDRDKEDDEVDKLINLQSLNRGSNRESIRRGIKSKTTSDDQPNSPQSSRTVSAASDYFDELTPSEDEGGDVADETAPPVRTQAIENCLAKNSLMNDKESDDENNTIVKKEKTDDDPSKKVKQRGRPKRYKDQEKETENSDGLMLTADKMMNKELQQLHAPIVLTSGGVLESTSKKSPIESKKKINKKFHTMRERTKSDGESSEEEKQWVNTKEKLLKRMGKKHSDTSVDDAKRARLVNEFIERRKAACEPRKLYSGVRGPRSRKKFLERQKQLSALSKELYGESSTSHAGKKYSYAYFKGRRNIRKVLDKKSLARSTVVANMEEFERKRRLHTRQNKLREILGYEEDVNVVVINDEVCLEYDFEAFRPVVTVHPFFTKVMKAHQYEGVKFMWDACFESLSMVEAGHGGGGCILAHCMGLGKTLQVLALLHTVLTHPRLGIQRVLVCCPLSTVLNWVDEIHKWIGPVTDKIKVFELSKLKKTYERAYQLEDWYKGGGIFIIGYELFRSLTTLDPEVDNVKIPIYEKIRMALLDPGPDIIVCDEGHLLKNDSSVLALAMSRVATKRRIVLTGTPMQNNLREYYCMVDFVKPNLLGTYKEYSNRFENPIMNGQHRDSQEEDIKLMKARTHILHKVLEGCLQRQEASVLYPYLPKKHEYTVFISLTKCQSDLYRHYLKHCANRSRQSVLRDFHTLQKIWSHPQVLHHFQIKTRDVAKVKAEKEDDLAHADLGAREDMKPGETEVWWLQYLDGGSMLDTLYSSNKFVAVFRILDECVALGDKVLIFSTSLFTLDALEYFLKSINKWSLGQEYYRLDGSVPPEVRQKWCREFNAENNVHTKLFLISTRAGSLGLNMTAANRVIILDTSWNPAHDIQSIFRVYRFGQKKDCYIYRLVALGTMEQKIYERAVTKQAVACRVVDEQQIDRHYNLADLTELYRFDELGAGVAGGVAVGVCDVVLLRVARDAALHAVHEHDSLLRGSSEQGLPEHERNAAWMQFQQEHSHREIPNQLIPSESKVVKVEIPKQGDDFQPPAGAKPKKGKKKNVDGTAPDDSINAPEDSGEVITSELGAPNDHLVEKITDILIKHNIQSQQFGIKETSMLIQNVRLCISTGQMHHLDKSDELTRSIAKILLEEYKAPGKCAPVETVVAASVSGAGPSKPRKRLSPDEDEEFTPPAKSLDTVTATQPPAPSRKKRKAALVAEKSFDTLVKESVINLDDDDWDRNFDEIDYDPKNDSSPTPPAKTKTFQKPAAAASKQQNDEVSPAEMDSIMLSDDDEPTLVETDKKPLILEKPAEKSKPKPLSAKKTKKMSDAETKTAADGKMAATDGKMAATDGKMAAADGKMVAADAEPVPLHKSLLTNKNFIKIVAHTYLAGNSLLDEGAATLAARYSTYKALEEVEKTGNSLTEGPIYDIAVKVLGKDVLKQLNKTTIKICDTEKVKSVNNSAIMKEPSLDNSVTNKAIVVPVEGKKKVSGPARRSTITDIKVTAGGAGPPPPAVVPVGLIHRAANATPSAATAGGPQLCGAGSRDECILPDDDDVRIVDLPAPTPPAGQRKLNTQAKTNIEPAGSYGSNMAETKNTANHPPTLPTIKIVNGKIMRDEHKVPLKQPPVVLSDAQHQPAVASFASIVPDSDTICLDSDDEDAAATAHAAAGASNEQRLILIPQAPQSEAPHPVPVSLTAANPNTFVPAHSFPNFLQNPQMNHAPNTRMNFDANPQMNIAKNSQLTYISDSELSYVENSQIFSTPDQNIILVPTKSVTKLRTVPKSVVTAALSKTPFASNLALSSTPALLDSTTPKLTPKTLTKITPKTVPKITPKIQSNPVPAMAKPNVTKTNVKDATAITNKTFCQPGDIIRVGKNGKLEILNRGGADTTPSLALADPITISDDVEPAPAAPPAPYAPADVSPDAEPDTSRGEAPVLLEAAAGRRSRSASTSSSSSSGSSRSPSPHNPLSILKDVVHIRADNYERPKKNKSAPTQPLTKTSSNSSNVGHHSETTSSSKRPSSSGSLLEEVRSKLLPPPTFTKSPALSQLENKAGDTSRKSNVAINATTKKTSVFTRKNNAVSSGPADYIDLTDQTHWQVGAPKATVGGSKAAVGTSKAAVGTSKAAVGTSKAAVGTSKAVVGTSKAALGTSKAALGTTKAALGTSKSAIAGSSKSILLQSDGALTKVAPTERAGPSKLITPNLLNKVKNTLSMKLNNFASKTKPKVETNKRPSPSLSTETNAAKKKKTFQTMTLEDFDLDDMDVDLGDIIELE